MNSAFRLMVNAFNEDFVPGRWGSVCKVVRALARIQKLLRVTWDMLKFRFRDTDHAGSEEKGVRVEAFGKAITSDALWSWIDLCVLLSRVLDKMEALWHGCPCHPRGDTIDEDALDTTQAVNWRALGLNSCPASGWLVASVVAGAFDDFTHHLLTLLTGSVSSMVSMAR